MSRKHGAVRATPAAPRRWEEWVLPAGIAATVFACFAATLTHEFVTWDDPGTVVENLHYRGLSPSHLGWMFTTFHMGHYQPLSWVTLALDYLLWGMNPTGYHLTNVVLHVGNALLFFALARRLLTLAFAGSGRRPSTRALALAAAGAALFFAVHPLRVESVAWVSERRDVLSGTFFLAALLFYLRLRSERGASRSATIWFAASVGCLMLSLLAKAWGMTLPVVLLALDLFPLRRMEREPLGRLVFEKWPWAIPAALAAGTALLAQWAGAEMADVSQHSLAERMAQAAYGLCFYLYKTVLPLGLSPLYALPADIDPLEPRFLAAGIAAVGITAASLATVRRWPWLAASWLAYVAIVAPVLGFAQTGPQIAADRYTYLSCLPWALLVAAGLLVVPQPRVAIAAGSGIVLALIGLTVPQSLVWRDSLVLWNHVIRLDPGNAIAHVNRGTAYEERGDLDAALADYEAALRLNRNYADAYFGRGNVRRQRGDLAGALRDFDVVVQLRPKDPKGHANRGASLHMLGRLEEAVADYERALELATWDWAFRTVVEENLTVIKGDDRSVSPP